MKIKELKQCFKCGEDKPHMEFHRNKAKPDGLQTMCKSCRHKLYRKNAEQVKDRSRTNYLRRTYDMSLEDYASLLIAQEHSCAVCGGQETVEGQSLSVDHCHSTGKVRGLLCFNCNAGIGRLGDTIEGLTKALRYLEGQD